MLVAWKVNGFIQTKVTGWLLMLKLGMVIVALNVDDAVLDVVCVVGVRVKILVPPLSWKMPVPAPVSVNVPV